MSEHLKSKAGDDQRWENPPYEEENPFLLFKVTFTVVGSSQQQSPIDITQLSLATAGAQKVTDASAENATFTVE